MAIWSKATKCNELANNKIVNIYISTVSDLKKKIPDDCGTKDNNPALIVVADLSPCPRTNKDRYRWRRCTAQTNLLHFTAARGSWLGAGTRRKYG